jgi:hypothetical protein
VFSRADALDCGESDKSLGQALRAGVIVRLRRGMYVDADLYNTGDDAGKHLLHARAALAAQVGDVALTGPSAAALYGFALYQQDLSVVHLVRLDHGSSHRAAQASHHRPFPRLTADEVSVVDGIRVVTAARAIWEVACTSSLESGVVTADAALRLDAGVAGPLDELQQRFAFVPGSRMARLAVRLADGRSESPGESVTRVQFHRFGIPMPRLQYKVVDVSGRLVGISDFYWEDFRHLGEFDGFVKYQQLLRPGESPADSVFREKRREDAMRAGLRGMTRFVWPMVMPQQARRTMAELCGALEQSRRLYVLGRAITS